MNVWGLTGGIASGKSTVARLFEKHGIPVIDADQIARELSSPGGKAFPSILQRFGTADRAELRKIIFSDPKARRDLEGILHPLIRMESLEKMKRRGGSGPVLYEAALLIEIGRLSDFRGLIVVEATRDEQKRRLMERDGAQEDLAESILAAQTSDEQRRQAATFLIQNSGSLEDLEKQVVDLIPKL